MEELFKIDEVTMESADSEWIDDAMKRAGIKLEVFAMLDILYQDQAMLANAMRSGDRYHIYLAILHMMDLRMLRGDRDQWVEFAKECLAYSELLQN